MAVKKPQSKKDNLPVKWEDKLAQAAEEAAKSEEGSGGGTFFSVKSGVLSYGDAPIPGNQMAVIILDTIFENVFYDGAYDPDTPQGPLCFSFGRVQDDMVPHTIVTDAGTEQHNECRGCPMNEFGSADTGKGKACRNTRRLALIPAGKFGRDGSFEIFDEQEHFESAQIAFMKLPVTSVKGYATFVKQVADALKRPPFGIITKIKVVPDVKTQFKVVFEPIENVPDELMEVIFARNTEAKSIIDFPYQPYEEVEQPKKQSRVPAKKVVAKKPVARKGKY